MACCCSGRSGPKLASTGYRFASYCGPAWLPIHRVAFISWIAFIALHVLAHIADSGRSVRLELGSDGPTVTPVPACNRRLLLLGVLLLLGAGLALNAIPDFSAWTNF